MMIILSDSLRNEILWQRKRSQEQARPGQGDQNYFDNPAGTEWQRILFL